MLDNCSVTTPAHCCPSSLAASSRSVGLLEPSTIDWVTIYTNTLEVFTQLWRVSLKQCQHGQVLEGMEGSLMCWNLLLIESSHRRKESRELSGVLLTFILAYISGVK